MSAYCYQNLSFERKWLLSYVEAWSLKKRFVMATSHLAELTCHVFVFRTGSGGNWFICAVTAYLWTVPFSGWRDLQCPTFNSEISKSTNITLSTKQDHTPKHPGCSCWEFSLQTRQFDRVQRNCSLKVISANSYKHKRTQTRRQPKLTEQSHQTSEIAYKYLQWMPLFILPC